MCGRARSSAKPLGANQDCWLANRGARARLSPVSAAAAIVLGWREGVAGMVDVFISYSRSNQEVVARLAEAVKAEGYSVWWDAELPPHLSYGDVITEKIGAAKAAIVVWSEIAAASEWVRAEADVARNQKKLIQVSIDDRMPPLPFNQIQFASIGDWRGEPDHPGWRKVKASLAALCGESDRPAAPPTPRTMTPQTPPVPVPPYAAAPRTPATRLIVAMLAILVLLAAAAVALLWMRSAGGASDATARQEQAPAGEGREDAAAPAAAAPSGRFTHAAVIEDPDGYTNVRSAASAEAAILARVEDGETFTTFPQSGGWWQVRIADGTIGYMAASRIRLAATGRPAAAAADRGDAAGTGEILPDSDTRLLTEEDLESLGRHELFIARNEIYARHGRPFRSPDLQRHFSRFDWYRPREGEVALSPTEQANVRLIWEEEQER